MGGGAAVIGAIGAIAELGLPLDVLGVLPAAENMIDGASFRPGDIMRTASGLTVENTNPDAEGPPDPGRRALVRGKEGVTHLVDVATLTGAMRAALGDMYIGVFGNGDEWRAQVVDAGNSAGDHAWPWPMHRRYRRLLDSPLADIRNTSGRSFGYAIIAATFLERFVGDVPWAHLDIHSTAFLDEDRDYLAKGASGAGVRLLTEVARGLAEGRLLQLDVDEVARHLARQRLRPALEIDRAAGLGLGDGEEVQLPLPERHGLAGHALRQRDREAPGTVGPGRRDGPDDRVSARDADHGSRVDGTWVRLRLREGHRVATRRQPEVQLGALQPLEVDELLRAELVDGRRPSTRAR